MKTALITGSTGLIGSQLVEILLNSNQYEKVVAFVKRLWTSALKIYSAYY